jgi:putative Holliday junction resolvase
VITARRPGGKDGVRKGVHGVRLARDWQEGLGEMRSLGLDVGGERTGVAISDPQGILATPLTVLASRDEDALIKEILAIVSQNKVERIVVGLPRQLNGDLGRQANKVTAFVDKLSAQAKQNNFDQPDMHLWDERLSTKAAERLKTKGGGQGGSLRSRGRRGAKNRNFAIKAEVDAIAAAIILQGFLDSQHSDVAEEY